MAELRTLVIVLGDQLDADAAAFDGFDPAQDAAWMCEAEEESTHVWSSQPRIVMFLSGMRHFAQALRAAGRPLHYRRLDAAGAQGAAPSLAAALREDLQRLRPQRLVMTAPGDWRVWQSLKATAADAGLALEICEDRHFFASVREFAEHARGRKQLRLEYWYRELRQRHRVLLEPDGGPMGGRWNYDEDNREPFGRDGPGAVPPRASFAPDEITREVITLVRRRFARHPGALDSFAWPMTRAQALQSLARFVDERLAGFGRHQDAIWPGEPWLWHSHLSAALNLKLLNAHEVVAAAEQAHREGRAPLASVEGFIRQVLGWREYVRGVYWTQMPGYLERNALDAHQPLPAFYWTGDTDMACLREAIGQTLAHGYAHHIQRLMVTGLFALLLGVKPREVHAWYLAVYVDAVEWVELPNVLGMSQYADAVRADGAKTASGAMGSKPYIASGQYIDRMSPHCAGCRYDPAQRTGPKACPFTTLYWDFLMRHEPMLAANPRTVMQVRNLARLDAPQRAAIRAQADTLRAGAPGRTA